MTTDAEKSKPSGASHAVSSPSPNPEKTKVPAQRQEAERVLLRRLLLSSAPPPTDWLSPPAPPNAVGLTQCIYSNARLIQKHSHRHTQNNVQPTVWVPSGPIS